jgi:hypothetical protein
VRDMIDSFDAKAIHHKLERLRRKGKIGARRAELLKPWPSMKDDMSIIYEELLFEIRKIGHAPSFLKSVDWKDDDNFSFQMPDWWNEACRRFRELYKQPEADVRFEKAMALYGERMLLHCEGRSTLISDEIERLLAECLDKEQVNIGTA